MIARLGVSPFAVIDLETTGLKPSQDRIVEIAVVRLNPNGVILDSWETLVNPRRDPGPTFAHGLTSEDLAAAPLFMTIADEITQRLDGAVVAAHNVNFDYNFLKYEYGRIGRYVPAWPCLCTVRMAQALRRVVHSKKLVDLCAQEGIAVAYGPLPEPLPEGIARQGGHSALGDAMATARLLAVYLRYAAAAGLGLPEVGARPLVFPDPVALTLPGLTYAVPRRRA